MALQQQNVPVQFRGLETKLDPRQAVIGDVVLLENVRFDAPPKFQKRFGYDRLGKAPAGALLSTFDGRLLVGTGDTLRELDTENTVLNPTAPRLLTANVSSRPVASVGRKQPVDHAINAAGDRLFIYGTTLGMVLQDAEGRTGFSNPGISGADPKRAVCVGDRLVALYLHNGNEVRGYVANVNLTGFTMLSTSLTGVSAGSPVDATVVGSTCYVFYRTAAGIVYATIDSALNVSAPTTLLAGIAPTALGVFAHSTTHFWLAYSTGTGVTAYRFTTAGAVTAGPITLSVLAGISLISGANYADTHGAFFYEIRDSVDAWKSRVVYRSCEVSGGALGSETTVVRGQGLASRPAYVPATAGAQPVPLLHVLTVYPSKYQPTYFLFSGGVVGDFVPSGKAAAGVAGELGPTAVGPPSLLRSGNVLSVHTARVTTVVPEGGEIKAMLSAEETSFDLAAKLYSQETGQVTLFSGSILSSWDGVALTEHGFHLYPEHVTVTPDVSALATGPTLSSATPGTGGNISPGTRYYRVSAVFADGTESFASNELSAVSPGPGNDGKVTLVWTSVASAARYRIYVGFDAPDLYSWYLDTLVVLTIDDTGPGGAWFQVPENRPLLDVDEQATYQVCALYEWTDAQGVVHQSAPSPATETVASKNSPSFGYVVETLRCTAKPGFDVRVVIYRTAGNQSVFFRVTPIWSSFGASPMLSNDPTVDTVSFSEAAGAATLDETYLKGCQQLVFNPLNSLAEVPPLPADPPKFLTRYRNRIVAIPSERPGQVCFSKVINPDVPIEFNPQQFYLPVQGGAANLVGAIEMDDKLILFGEDRIYYTAGDGPAPNGTGNDYANPYRVPSDVGCVNPRSLVLTPMGVLFQSFKGIYLLGRDLSVQYFGAPVEGFGTTPITSANTLPDCQRIVLTLSSGVALVYDSFVQKWAVWTNYNAADALVYGGKFTHLRPDGSINRENTSRFTDQEAATNAAVLIKFVTSWLSFAGLNGFQRVWRFMILGDYKSAHSLQVEVAFDDDPAIVQSITFDATAAFDALSFAPYELLVKLAKQKCSNLQVTISELAPGGEASPGEGLSLSTITFLAGLLPGLHKVSVGRTIS